MGQMRQQSTMEEFEAKYPSTIIQPSVTNLDSELAKIVLRYVNEAKPELPKFDRTRISEREVPVESASFIA